MARPGVPTAALRSVLMLARASAQGLVLALDEALSMLSVGPSYPSSGRSSNEQDEDHGRTHGRSSGRSRPPRASELSNQDLPLISGESETRESSSSADDDLRPTVVPTDGRTLGQPDEGRPDEGDRALLTALTGAWDGMGGAHTSGSYRGRLREKIPQLRMLAARAGSEPEAMFAAAVRRFKADHAVRAKRYGLPVLLAQLEQWVDDVPPAPAPEVQRPSRKLLNPADGPS